MATELISAQVQRAQKQVCIFWDHDVVTQNALNVTAGRAELRALRNVLKQRLRDVTGN